MTYALYLNYQLPASKLFLHTLHRNVFCRAYPKLLVLIAPTVVKESCVL